MTTESGPSRDALLRPAKDATSESTLKAVRKYLWLNHGHHGQYGDDGEMQCMECIGACPGFGGDYKREPFDRVVAGAIATKEALSLQQIAHRAPDAKPSTAAQIHTSPAPPAAATQEALGLAHTERLMRDAGILSHAQLHHVCCEHRGCGTYGATTTPGAWYCAIHLDDHYTPPAPDASGSVEFEEWWVSGADTLDIPLTRDEEEKAKPLALAAWQARAARAAKGA